MKIVVVGDNAVRTETLADAAKQLDFEKKEIVPLTWGEYDSASFRTRAHNLELHGPEAEEPPQELYEEIENADCLIVHFCPVSKKLIGKAKQLKLIMTCRGGTEHVDLGAATAAGIPVMHIIRNAEATSDFTLGLILAETRNIARSHADMMKGQWVKSYPNQEFTKALYEMTLGVVGVGNIGRLVAAKASALGMRVIGYDAYVSEEDLRRRGLNIEMKSKEEVFREADVVSLHLKVTPETTNSIGKKELDLMKKEAYLINASRAAVLVKEDLLDTLAGHRIAGAALDVYWEEPLAPDDPLLSLDNVTLTPHNAGSVKSALGNSPYLAVRVINQYLADGESDMCLNKLAWKG